MNIRSAGFLRTTEGYRHQPSENAKDKVESFTNFMYYYFYLYDIIKLINQR